MEPYPRVMYYGIEKSRALKDQFIKESRYIEDTPLLSIPRRTDYTPVAANSNMEDLISKAVNQNFIPVLDDANRFIGIITRKDIIQHCYSNMNQSTK